MTRDRATPSHWFSLIAASPNPENEEAVNVAFVVGNGYATRLEFLERLPRLCGLASAEDVSVYEAMLRSLADRVNRGIDPAELQAMMGPQLRIMRQRQLFREPTDELFARLKRQYLERPVGQTIDDATKALVRRSTVQLDKALARAIPLNADITNRATPRKLYGHKLDRHVGYRIPPVARAVRLPGVDVLIDSLVVEPETKGRPLSQAAVRVSQAFYAYNKLRAAIRGYVNRDVQTIGVLHPSEPTDDPDTLQRRDWVRHLWSADALVIDGNDFDVSEELSARLASLR